MDQPPRRGSDVAEVSPSKGEFNQPCKCDKELSPIVTTDLGLIESNTRLAATPDLPLRLNLLLSY